MRDKDPGIKMVHSYFFNFRGKGLLLRARFLLKSLVLAYSLTLEVAYYWLLVVAYSWLLVLAYSWTLEVAYSFNQTLELNAVSFLKRLIQIGFISSEVVLHITAGSTAIKDGTM